MTSFLCLQDVEKLSRTLQLLCSQIIKKTRNLFEMSETAQFSPLTHDMSARMVKKRIGGAVNNPIPGKSSAKDVATAMPRKPQGSWMALGCKQESG
jgi:hypothetical protein